MATTAADRDIRVAPQVGIDVLLDHYDFLKRPVGPDHVGIGADFTLDAGLPPGWGRLEE